VLNFSGYKMTDKQYILLVDDDDSVLQGFELTLNSAGLYNLILCKDSRDVVGIIETNDIELILLDLMMPYISGEKLLNIIADKFPEIPVIIITRHDDTETVVNCIKCGALDYFVKPVDAEILISKVKRVIERSKLLKENKNLRDGLLSNEIRNPELLKAFNTENKKVFRIFKYAEAISQSPEPILITGETGVGKELMAETIHKLSGRKGCYIPLSVAGLDDNMFSDTLFGHVKGAFTDAGNVRVGLIEKAKGGTLFLDEIGDLSQLSQIKLLRFIQEKEYFQLGSDFVKYVDTNIITATNKNLEEMMISGEFRKDLYFRLEVHKIELPPLRERKEDLKLLINFFLKESAKIYNKRIPKVQNDLCDLLKNYSFPGNIRELRSMIYNAMSTHFRGVLSVESFKSAVKLKGVEGNSDGIGDVGIADKGYKFPYPLPSLKEMEKILLREALRESNGNRTKAAGILGITRQTLNNKLKLIK